MPDYSIPLSIPNVSGNEWKYVKECIDTKSCPRSPLSAPINAVVYNGASPIFMDAEKYYNINAEKIIEFITNQTVFKD